MREWERRGIWEKWKNWEKDMREGRREWECAHGMNGKISEKKWEKKGGDGNWGGMENRKEIWEKGGTENLGEWEKERKERGKGGGERHLGGMGKIDWKRWRREKGKQGHLWRLACLCASTSYCYHANGRHYPRRLTRGSGMSIDLGTAIEETDKRGQTDRQERLTKRRTGLRVDDGFDYLPQGSSMTSSPFSSVVNSTCAETFNRSNDCITRLNRLTRLQCNR